MTFKKIIYDNTSRSGGKNNSHPGFLELTLLKPELTEGAGLCVNPHQQQMLAILSSHLWCKHVCLFLFGKKQSWSSSPCDVCSFICWAQTGLYYGPAPSTCTINQSFFVMAMLESLLLETKLHWANGLCGAAADVGAVTISPSGWTAETLLISDFVLVIHITAGTLWYWEEKV